MWPTADLEMLVVSQDLNNMFYAYCWLYGNADENFDVLLVVVI